MYARFTYSGPKRLADAFQNDFTKQGEEEKWMSHALSEHTFGDACKVVHFLRNIYF